MRFTESMHGGKNKQKFISKLKSNHSNWNLYEKLLFGINLLATLALLIYSAIVNIND